MRVHVIRTGTLEFKEALFRSRSRAMILTLPFRRGWFEFPVHAYLVEHDDGHILIDSGATHKISNMPGIFRVHVTPDDEIGPQMRAKGLRPEDVRLLIPTHLDQDHVGGVGHFPNARTVVHRPEFEYAKTFGGKQRYRPQGWPDTFKPELYDLGPEPLGPFPQSLSLTDKRDVTLVPIPGHSIAQVGIVVRTNGATLFFGADHITNQKHLVDNVGRGRLSSATHFHSPKQGRESTRRIVEFARQTPIVFLPAHDADAEMRLEALDTLKI